MHALFIPYGNFLFKYRNLVFPLMLLTLFLVFPPRPLFGDIAADMLMDAAGILLILAGLGLRAAVIGLAYIKRGGANKKIHADTLVTNGLFAHCRNPLYVGNLLVVAGLLIIFNNPWVYVAGGVFFTVSYAAIVCAEEAFLLQKFGDAYREYCAHVGRWSFKTDGLPATLSSMEFNWQRVLYKDYTTMLTWVVTVILVLNLEQIQYVGLHHSYRYILCSALVAGTAGALAWLVRRRKKSGQAVPR